MRHSSRLPRHLLWIIPVLGLLAGESLPAQTGPLLNIQPSGTNEVQITWPPGTNFNVLEENLGLDGTNMWEDVPDAPTPLGAVYSVREAATNAATFYRLAQRGAPGVSTPPDPASVATPLATNVFNAFGASAAFLYSGSNAIQIGVAPGTIQAVQAAVLRGTVRQRNGVPLPGVRVALLNHPEFGYTYTRTDGMFDLAVNASQYTVDFEAVGYITLHRQAQLTGQSYFMLPDVVMIGLDAMATAVTLGSNAPAQIAPSTPQTDAAGTRSATVFFPPGTTATMVLPNGSSQELTSLTVRVTEYTVGSNGPAAMPAALPPNSGYTYCAEFSADEAVAAGATTVQFSQPVPVYVDNFLDFPVGLVMPLGYYDRTAAAWMSMSNGIVMEVLGSTNGSALVDLHGTGQAEPADVLAANGFTAEELQQLASLYPAGKTLWRCAVPHFSAFDENLIINPPDPNKPPGTPKPTPNPNDNSDDNYGTLNFSAQTFTEEIPLVGVPFDLHYNSARVPDYRVNSEVTVPVKWVPPPPTDTCDPTGSGGTCVSIVPVNYLQRPPSNIRVDLNVSGELDAEQILPESATSATVAWDGRDGYGRLVGGTCNASISVSYQYTNWDYGGLIGGPEVSAEFPDLFGNDGNAVAFEGHIGTTLGIGATFRQTLTYPDHRALGFGAWSPTVLHRFDPVGGILYYGDGRIRAVPQATLQDNFQTQLVGLGVVNVAAAPDGSIYFNGDLSSGGDENYIFRRLPSGAFQVITQNQDAPGAVYPLGADGWSTVDGQPVSKVSVAPVGIQAMCVGPDGSVYITDDFAIARLTPDGIWHVIMGGAGAIWPPVFQPDGTPATNSFATSGAGVAMAVGPDSSVYFTGEWSSPDGATNYYPIRKIAPNGRIYTVYGATGTAASGAGSEYWYNLFGSSAFAAKGTDPIRALAVGGDGTLYVSPGELFDGGGMFRISTGGVILPLLSNGPITGAGQGYNPADTNNAALIQGDEGKLATQVTSGANATRTIAVGPDGSVYFTPDDQIVWRIDPDGILERFAGRYASTTYDPPNYPADGADPLNTYLYPVTQLAVTPDNTVVLIREDAAQLPEILLYPVRTAAQGLLATPAETQNIPSEDGSEIYVFSIDGRHLSTLDGLTGATKWSFGYDTNSLVVTMTDGAGLTTLITRDGTGNPTAIVGPYGQVTALGLDGNGFLSTVSNPANETTTLASTSGGLLSSVTGPLGETYKVSYDSLGRVTQVTDPLGGGWIDAVTNVGFLGDMSYEVNVDCTNSSGDTLTRVLVLEPDGSTSEVYYTGGLGTEGTRVALNGNETINVADGSYGFVGVGADPRFGSQVSQPNYSLLQLPSNVTLTASAQLSAGLAVNGDPLSLTGLTNVTTVNGNSYTQVYNASNHTLAITSPAGKNSITASDSLGRINHIVAPGQPTVDLAYDTNGRLVFETNTSAAGAALTTFSYNALGQISTVTDALGRANGFAYTAAGRLQQQTLPDGSIVGLTEDSEGNLTSVTPPGRPAHTFQYNNAGLLTKYTPPLVGTDESATFQYDSERYITQASLPDGQAEVYSYGPNHQLQQLTLGSGAILSYQYGTNFGSGYLSPAAITSSTGEGIQFGYTASIRTMETWSGTIAGQFTVQLNNNLLAASRSVNGSSVSYGYDPDQMLIQAGNMSLTRDPAFGFITGTTLGAAADQRGYDDRGLLTNYSAGANGIPLWSMNLSYDLIRRLTNKVETIAGQTQTFGYVYDLAGRLQQVSLNGAVNSAYTYDTNGNRLTRNDETATYDAQDRVLTYAGSNFTWSSDGNLLTAAAGGQTTTYSYDVRGVLLSAALPGSQVDYVIDPLGHRVGKQLGGVLEKGWLWDGIVPVAEVDANSSVTARFVYAADGTTPSFMVTGSNTYRIYSDERGSVRLVVNQTDGSVAQQLNYDEFGRVTLDTSPGFQPFGYAGGLYDPDTGLVHFGLRDYSPALGRWLQRDPISFAGGDFSLFNYVYNDPINLSDPTGCGPMQKLRQAALNGNPRAQVAYQNLLKANQNIATGEGEDALKSVKAYNNAIRVSNASIAVLGTAGGISAVYSGVAVFTSVGGAVTATQAAGGTFLVMNGLVGTGGNIANVAINGLGAPSGQAVNATAPTSIAQGVLPAGPAAAVDLILAQKLPSPSNVPAWVSTANDWSGASDKVANSQTLLGQ